MPCRVLRRQCITCTAYTGLVYLLPSSRWICFIAAFGNGPGSHMASVSSPLNSSSGMRPWSLLYFPPSESTETQKPKKFCMKVGLALAVNVRGNETMHTAPAIRYISVTMTPSRRGRARQFLHALAAILLVTCSFTSQASTNVSEAHKIASMAIDVNPDEVNGLLRQQNSPQELLHRGIALLHEGGANKEAVRVLEAAVTLWQEEVRIKKSTRQSTTPHQQLPEIRLHIRRDYYLDMALSIFRGHHRRPRPLHPSITVQVHQQCSIQRRF